MLFSLSSRDHTFTDYRGRKKNLGINLNELFPQKIAAGADWQHFRFVQYDNRDPGHLGKVVCKIFMKRETAGKYSWEYLEIGIPNLESMTL